MSQLPIRFLILNIYMFALFCQSGEVALLRNQAKWPISQSFLDTSLFDFFSFKKADPAPPKNEAVAGKISAKQKPFRSLVLWWPKVQQEVVSLAFIPSLSECVVQSAIRHGRTPLELFEILII